MPHIKRDKQKRIKRFLLFGGLVSLALSLTVGVLLFSLQYDDLWGWYSQARESLLKIEQTIAEIREPWLFILVILLLFLFKMVIPVYPISSVCFLTGLVLPTYLAIPVNLIGLTILLTVGYLWGAHLGPGSTWKLMRRWETVGNLVEHDGQGNPLLLVALRLMPFMPINPVSKIYGSYSFEYYRYLVLSLVGLLPRLISFTFVGRNLFDPLSAGFLVPLMIILFLSGVSMLSASGAWLTVERISQLYKKRKERDDPS